MGIDRQVQILHVYYLKLPPIKQWGIPNRTGIDMEQQLLVTPGVDEHTAMTSTDNSPSHSSGSAEDTKKEVKIVLAGKSGAGKTTLARNILGFEEKLEFSAGPLTQECDTQEATKNDITVRVTDTIGLGQQEGGRRKELKKLFRHTKGEADLLVYCIPVDPSSKFECTNPAIMKSIQDAYGKDIWKHCIIVFTFSNITVYRFLEKMRDRDQAFSSYKNHLLAHATRFRKELERLKVKDVNIKTVFGFETEDTTDDPTATAIVAVPAGDKPDDPVLPDFKDPTSFRLSTNPEESIRIDITDWREILFIEIIRKCGSTELKKKLLQYRYGFAKSIAGITVGGLMGGAAVGAGAGAVLGLLVGPFGVGPGALVGAVVGGTTGALGGGVGGGVIGRVRKSRENKA